MSSKMAKRFNLLNNRIFRNRNIIVVSQGEVKHYPIGSKLQVFGLAAVMGCLSWASYSTGSYLSAQEIMEQKDRTIESTALSNRRINEQFDMLKRDLAKLDSKDGAGLSDYDRFVLSQHKSLDDKDMKDISSNLMQERIDYLEGMVNQMKTDRELLVSSIRARTKDQMVAYEDLLDATGLSLAKMLKQPQAKQKVAELEKLNEEQKLASTDTETTDAEFANQGGPFEPANPSQLSAEQMADEAAMFDTINDLVVLQDIVKVLPLAKPLAQSRVTSHFGRRVDPINKRWAVHKGMDFVSDYGAKVMSTSDGVVSLAETMNGYGHIVEIDHGYGLSTRYAHLDKILVREGQKVKKGTVIGTQGNSGRSTGSHVHYEVRFNQMALNPEKFVKAGLHVF